MFGSSTFDPHSRTGWLWRIAAISVFSIGILWLLNKQQPANPTNIHTPENNSDRPHEAPIVIQRVQDNPPSDEATIETKIDVVTVQSNPLDAKAVIDEPWATALSAKLPPWEANSPKLTEDYKSAGHDELPESEAKRWFAPVEGYPFAWSTDSMGKPARRIAKFQGLARFRAPWSNDAVLRITPFDVTNLTFYFWHGSTGVAFKFYSGREPNLWAAFEISRDQASPKPNRWGLLTSDNGSYSRSTTGMLDIRHQNRAMVLARGGIVLMSAPQVDVPTEVFVEGQFRLRGISMCRSAPFLDCMEIPQSLPANVPVATLPWTKSLEGSTTITNHDDGTVSFTFGSPNATETVNLSLERMRESARRTSSDAGLFAVILNIAAADPGTGIVLQDREGKPLLQLGFFRETLTQQVTFGWLPWGDSRVDVRFDLEEAPAPFVAKTCWIKIIAGLGAAQILTSGDGRHWGHIAENPRHDRAGTIESIGVFGLHGLAARSIRVRQVQLSELTGITDLQSLSPPRNEGASKETSLIETKHFDETDFPVASIADAIKVLSTGPSKKVGQSLLHQLIAAGMRSHLTFAQKRQMLDDACLISDLFDEDSAKKMADSYEELGWQLVNSDDRNLLPKIRASWLCSPIWTKHNTQSVCERLHAHEIIHSVYARDWPAVWSAARTISYWNIPANPEFHIAEQAALLTRQADWAKALVAENAPDLDDGSARVIPVTLRHPLAPVLNRDAYNSWAELQSALAGGTYEDACRIAIAISQSEIQGLLPEIDDRDLFVSLPTALARARTTHPEFAATMVDKFEPQGFIRVRSAINRRDFPGLRAAILQFVGTDAAREAQMWLGDFEMAIGHLDVAEEYFRDALVGASRQRREIVEPRLLLARTLDGKMSDTELNSSLEQQSADGVEFNGTTVSNADFRSLLESFAVRRESIQGLQETARNAPIPFPKGDCRLQLRSDFDGQHGINPGSGEFRSADPFGRQMSAKADDRQFFVSNRFQLIAYSVVTGQPNWVQCLGTDQGEAHAMPFTPMNPLLAGDRIFVRRLTKDGVELACLSATDGSLVWKHRPSSSVVTDPVIWNRQLFSLIQTKADEDQVEIKAAWFDPTTGSLKSVRPLFRLREMPEDQFSGQLTVNDRIAVCTVAGSTACFDWHGDMRWLRRHILMRKPIDELAEDFRVSPPVIQEGRAIVVIPGVREVRCVDLDTGRSVWSQPVSNLRGLVAATGSRVVADTVTGLLALDSATGESVWRYPIPSRLEATYREGQMILISRRSAVDGVALQPRLIWLDINSGEELGQFVVDIAPREGIQLGPMFSAGDKWWTFVGQTGKEPKRELHEVVFSPQRTSP